MLDPSDAIKTYELKKADRIEILTIVDNTANVLLPGSERIARPRLDEVGTILKDTLLAEHGLSLLVRVSKDREKHTVMLDTGYSSVAVPHNMDLLGVDPNDIEAIVLSHGHMDHTGALMAVLERINRNVDVVVHPDAFLFPRYVERPDGERQMFPRTLIKSELRSRKKVRVLERSGASLLAGELVLATGEVQRSTFFEKGMPNALVERNGKVEHDPIADDQSLVLNLQDRGLVVISGCAHAGIINTLRHAQRVTGEQLIFAVIGGFHLAGTHFEHAVEDTVRELKKFSPEVLLPMHCTGWKATHRLAASFPSAFELNSVGTNIRLP